MNYTFLFFIAIIVLFIPIFFYRKKRNKQKMQIKKHKIKQHIYIEAISLPSKIEDMHISKVFEITKKIFHTFYILDLKHLSEKEFDKKEWHTWQISILFKLYKLKKEFFIVNKKEIFHPIILQLDKESLHSLVQTILLKYKNYVNINKTKDFLSKEVIWSNKEISILFYFLSSKDMLSQSLK